MQPIKSKYTTVQHPRWPQELHGKLRYFEPNEEYDYDPKKLDIAIFKLDFTSGL